MPDPRFFRNSGPKKLGDLAKIAQAEPGEGADLALMIKDVAPLDQAEASDISFLDNIRYRGQFEKTKAGACIVAPEMVKYAPKGTALLLSKYPYRSYAFVAQAFYPEIKPQQMISPKADIHPSAQIGEGCIIESGAVIGTGVVIGRECRIGANAVISHALIGDHVRIYPGVCIGQDGFGFAIDPAGHVKVPQLGRVIIEDHVEIGANTCIDRGAGPDTVIGQGTWIDNLVMIGHNVKIGKGCIIIGQAGIAGSTVLEDYVVLAAQGGIAGHLHIGKGAKIGAQAGVMRDLEGGKDYLGAPAVPVRDFMKQTAILNRMIKKDKS